MTVDHKSNDLYPYKKKDLETKTHEQRENGHVKIQAEIGVTQLETKECEGVDKHQKLGRSMEDSSLEPSREHGPANNLILDCQASELQKSKFLLF